MATPASCSGFGGVESKLDERVRDRVITETRGNPLALLELPRGLTPTELAGGFGVPGGEGSAQGRFGRASSDGSRRSPTTHGVWWLLAAAEPVGDPLLLWRAADRLGIAPVDAEAQAEAQGLLAIGERVRFRHPLARSAIYRSAAAQERRAVHLALAEATDQDVDPDRRAWHLAAAAAGPDEEVAFRASAFRGAGAGAWRTRCRGGVSGTRRRADARTQCGVSNGRWSRRRRILGRRVRRGSRAAGRGRGGAHRRGPTWPAGPAARRDRVCLAPRQRRPGNVASGCKAT